MQKEKKKNYAKGDVKGGSSSGGLVGINSGGTISNSYATGDVTGEYDEIGGFVGINRNGANDYKGTITGAYSVG